MINSNLKPYYNKALKLAWPCIVETVLLSAVFVADAIMVGNLGAVATAAVGVNQPVNWLINSLSAGIAVGASVLVAINVGAEEFDKAKNIARQAVFASILFGLFMTALVFLLSPYIPVWIGVSNEVKPGAVFYLRTLSLSLSLHFTGFVSSGILRGAGNTKTPMLIAMFTNLVNVMLNILLIYPSRNIYIIGAQIFLPGAGLGVKGAAIATALAQCVSGGILIAFLFNKNNRVYIWLDKTFRFQKQTIANILKVGLPAAGERCSVNLGMVFFQSIVANLGTVAISAHYLSTIIESLSYMPALGFSTAATTLVGQSIGAKNKEDAIIYSKITLLWACIIGSVGMVAFLFMPELLYGFFTKDLRVIEAGSAAIRVMAFAEPLLCMNFVLTGILRGAGDTKIPFLTSLAGMWGVRQVCAWFFAYSLGFGLTGAFIGMALDVAVRFGLNYIRFMRRKWLMVKIST